MTPVRALLVTPDFPPRKGGIQRLLERLVRHGDRVVYDVMAPSSPDDRAWDADQPFTVHRTATTRDRRLDIARLNLEAVALARRLRPDVVLAGHVVTAPGAIAIKRALHIPFAVYLYALEVPERARLASTAIRESGAAIAISRYTADLAREAGAPPERIRIVPPGVDLVEPHIRTANGHPPVVLTVARLEDRYKGFDVMVRALPLIRARVPDAEWVVVGDGRRRADILRLAEASGVRDAIRMCGSLPDAERDAWYDRAGVFAMPSRLPPGSAGEGFGIVYLEAATRGVPSVAGAVGGALDAIADGETGILVDPRSHIEVADAVSGLLEDPERSRRMGAAAAQFATRFAWPRVAEEVEAVLLEVASGRS
jgi:phosphatidylinositol alpha-1,6-mannosyltransferase